MKSIMLSIHPRYVKEIFAGTKKYELRKSFPKNKINKIIIYETSPISKIVGEITVEQLKEKKETFYNNHKQEIGVTKQEFDTYYEKNEEVFVYKIIKYLKYKKPKKIEEYGKKFAPQNFYYIN